LIPTLSGFDVKCVELNT